jgi:putative redox protein
MEKEIAINYSNDELTVVWKPKLCIHSTICWKELNTVFDPKEKKWIKLEGASNERIIEQVKRCPSGALGYIEKYKA